MLRAMIVVAAVASASAAMAGELKPEEARRFVAGKMFSYTCFEGTSGAGRINADGSVAGTIRVGGNAAPRYVTLPPGTIQVSPSAICASLRGMPFQPCFNVVQIDHRSFRGSISGLSFAYCDFVRHAPRRPLSIRADRPQPLQSAIVTTADDD
jgi:hypothetical protein